MGGFPLSSNFSVRTDVNFMGVNKIEIMHEVARVKVDWGSTFTFMRDLVSALFTHVKFMSVHVKVLRQQKSTLCKEKNVT